MQRRTLPIPTRPRPRCQRHRHHAWLSYPLGLGAAWLFPAHVLPTWLFWAFFGLICVGVWSELHAD